MQPADVQRQSHPADRAGQSPPAPRIDSATNCHAQP